MTGFATALALALLVAASPAAAHGRAADVCLEMESGAVTEAEWVVVTSAVTGAVEPRTALFPAPIVGTEGTRLDIDAGHGPGVVDGGTPCLAGDGGWTARFGRDFLESGADQLLAEAPTTPGITSSVDIEWYPDEARLRTTLVFAGPLDIPNGTCWIDDALSVDGAAGTVVASGEQGVKTSLFAEGACGRFFDHLPDGGAGAQAVALLPVTVELNDGAVLRLVAERVEVRDDAVIVAGSLERD